MGQVVGCGTRFLEPYKFVNFASRIAGTKGMKLVDSLHMATALQSGCEYLITHDKGIKPMEGIEIIQLSTIF